VNGPHPGASRLRRRGPQHDLVERHPRRVQEVAAPQRAAVGGGAGRTVPDRGVEVDRVGPLGRAVGLEVGPEPVVVERAPDFPVKSQRVAAAIRPIELADGFWRALLLQRRLSGAEFVSLSISGSWRYPQSVRRRADPVGAASAAAAYQGQEHLVHDFD
jgi:hypothetical protein